MDFYALEGAPVLTPILDFALTRAQSRLRVECPVTRACEFRVTRVGTVNELLGRARSGRGAAIAMSLDSDAAEALNLLRNRRLVGDVQALFAVGTGMSRDVEWLMHEAGVDWCFFEGLSSAADALARWWMRQVLRPTSGGRPAVSVGC